VTSGTEATILRMLRDFRNTSSWLQEHIFVTSGTHLRDFRNILTTYPQDNFLIYKDFLRFKKRRNTTLTLYITYITLAKKKVKKSPPCG